MSWVCSLSLRFVRDAGSETVEMLSAISGKMSEISGHAISGNSSRNSEIANKHSVASHIQVGSKIVLFDGNQPNDRQSIERVVTSKNHRKVEVISPRSTLWQVLNGHHPVNTTGSADRHLDRKGPFCIVWRYSRLDSRICWRHRKFIVLFFRHNGASYSLKGNCEELRRVARRAHSQQRRFFALVRLCYEIGFVDEKQPPIQHMSVLPTTTDQAM
jgi:hypothetical protein